MLGGNENSTGQSFPEESVIAELPQIERETHLMRKLSPRPHASLLPPVFSRSFRMHAASLAYMGKQQREVEFYMKMKSSIYNYLYGIPESFKRKCR